MQFISSTLSALSLLASSLMVAANPHPMQLQIVQHGDFLDIAAVSQETTIDQTRFQLEVVSRGAGGGSKTVQAGVIGPGSGGHGEKVLQSRIRIKGLIGWDARLYVTTGGDGYVISKSG